MIKKSAAVAAAIACMLLFSSCSAAGAAAGDAAESKTAGSEATGTAAAEESTAAMPDVTVSDPIAPAPTAGSAETSPAYSSDELFKTAKQIISICGLDAELTGVKPDRITDTTFGNFGELQGIPLDNGYMVIDGRKNMPVSLNLTDLPEALCGMEDEKKVRKFVPGLYESLQFPKEYVFRSINDCGDYYEAYFAKEVMQDLYSEYEAVKMMLTKDGRTITANSFCFPVLKAAEDVGQITENEAVELAPADLGTDAEYAEYVSASIETARPDGELYSRLVWAVSFGFKGEFFDTRKCILIDLFSSEVLGRRETQ